MFFNAVKYEILQNLRNRQVIVWLLLFPLVMGVLYKFTFGSIYEKNSFSAVPAAVVEHKEDVIFHLVMDAMAEAKNPILNTTYCDEEKAYALLESGEIKGILVIDPPEGEESAPVLSAEQNAAAMDAIRQYLTEGRLPDTDTENESWTEFLSWLDRGYLEQFVGMYQGGELIPETRLSLKVKGSGVAQTTIKKMAEMYANLQIMGRELARQNGAGEGGNSEKAAKVMEFDAPVVTNLELTKGNTDPFASYMYNLIAMVAIFGSLAGLSIAVNHQANLSAVGARRSCSGTPKLIAVLASLMGYFVSEIACVSVTVTFLVFVLKVDFGDRLPWVYLTGVCGGMMGVAMGFCFGGIGKWSQGAKTGIIMALNMTLCFLSGAMVPGIKGLLITRSPIVNALNPAAVVCDSLYYLSVDADLTRYFGKLLAMLIFTAVFVLLGFLLTRRRQYASL